MPEAANLPMHCCRVNSAWVAPWRILRPLRILAAVACFAPWHGGGEASAAPKKANPKKRPTAAGQAQTTGAASTERGAAADSSAPGTAAATPSAAAAMAAGAAATSTPSASATTAGATTASATTAGATTAGATTGSATTGSATTGSATIGGATGTTTEGADTEPPPPPPPAWTATLSLLEEYRLRAAGAPSADSAGILGTVPAANQATDQDLRFLVDGQVLGLQDHFRTQVSADLWVDLDGRPARATPDLFASQYDYQQPWLAVYTLSAEWRNSGALDLARVGRQTSEHGLPLTFDGASVEARPWGRKVSLFAFGGRTIHFFDATPSGLFENWVGSAGAVFRASDALRFEVDWRMLRETVPTVDSAAGTRVTNQAVGAAGIARLGQTQAKLFARSLDARLSHAGGAVTSEWESVRAGVDARVHAQLVTLGETAESENPFYAILGPSLPHVRAKVEGWKEFDIGQAATLGLHLGWRLRELLDGAESRFNRNMAGAYFQAELRDIFTKGAFLSGVAELNYIPWSPLRDQSLSLGGSGGYSNDTVKIEGGTYFQQYKTSYYQVVEELSSVRTLYGSFGYRLAPWLQARARYQLEIVDRYIHSAYLTLRQEF